MAIAFNNWGYALAKLGRHEEAIEKYERATQLDPKNAIAFNNWRYALVNLGRQEEADEKCARAADLDARVTCK
jgi:superkiller protein 3